MQRFRNINELVGQSIELYSELQPGQSYSVEGQEMTYQGEDEGQHTFSTGDGTHRHRQVYTTEDLQQLIDAGDVQTVSNQASGQTVDQYPHLDRFTRNTFGSPTQDIWQTAGLDMNETDLHTLDEMIRRHRLSEMPLPGEGKYPQLLDDQHWRTLKSYLTKISPDIDLPEELG